MYFIDVESSPVALLVHVPYCVCTRMKVWHCCKPNTATITPDANHYYNHFVRDVFIMRQESGQTAIEHAIHKYRRAHIAYSFARRSPTESLKLRGPTWMHNANTACRWVRFRATINGTIHLSILPQSFVRRLAFATRCQHTHTQKILFFFIRIHARTSIDLLLISRWWWSASGGPMKRCAFNLHVYKESTTSSFDRIFVIVRFDVSSSWCMWSVRNHYYDDDDGNQTKLKKCYKT